ncbi:hypothetical protein Glove_57g115 [Diversispora epigaea]|uniref:Uncharacterized protein n=1 Tax=Diversispora epigaea TaxID=1348612 RepID=A0A397JFR0_9GLOM|nr:hypothetical protein Glove_57g115 [Diversispora epigaea]
MTRRFTFDFNSTKLETEQLIKFNHLLELSELSKEEINNCDFLKTSEKECLGFEMQGMITHSSLLMIVKGGDKKNYEDREEVLLKIF